MNLACNFEALTPVSRVASQRRAASPIRPEERMAEEIIRYGIIGTRHDGLRAHPQPGAGAGRRGRRDRRLRTRRAANCGDASRSGATSNVYDDYRELLRRAPVDAVVIATPNFTHSEVLRAIFATRVHVLVEKPLCTEIERLPPGGRARPRSTRGSSGWAWSTATCGRSRGWSRRCTAAPSAGWDARDPRAPLPVPAEGRRLEPLQPQHGRNAGREVLPLLRPDEPDRRRSGRCASTRRAAAT